METTMFRTTTPHSAILLCITALMLNGCASGAPQYVKPQPPTPPDWTTWRGGDATLHASPPATEALPENWWDAFGDPVLNQLQDRAVKVSPDLQTAALHFAQARVQRQTVSAQRGPQVNLNAGATAQRQSEFEIGRAHV